MPSKALEINGYQETIKDHITRKSSFMMHLYEHKVVPLVDVLLKVYDLELQRDIHT